MRPKTVSINYERTFNLGNYESVRIGVQIWSEIDEDEDESGVASYLFESAKEQIKNQLPPSYKRANPCITTTFSRFGQPVDPEEMTFDEEYQRREST